MENQALAFFKASIGKLASEVSISPLGRWLNGKLVAVEDGSLTVEFVVRPEMTNPAQILHGGITASMIDDLMGMTVFSLGRDSFYTTVNLNLDYLAPAKVGDTVIVKTKVIRAGRSVVNIECEARHFDGKIIARATSNLISTGSKI